MWCRVGRWVIVVAVVLLVAALSLFFAQLGLPDGDTRHEPAGVTPAGTPTPRNYMCDCILTQIPTATPHPFAP